ncbi:MAG TPA: response regulator transcription factor [Longimicrobiaceae bacterium]
MKILVVDDDAALAEFIRLGLQEEGYAADVAHSAEQGRRLACVYDYDGIVLDRVLPDGTGVEVARELRRRGHRVPILMLTARGASQEVVEGLDAGADDYLVKPFEMEVLKARVRALVRRGGAVRSERLSMADLVMDRLSRRAECQGRELRLTSKEFTLLEYFLLHPARVVTRTELLEKVWEIHFDPGSNVVDVHVARLRRKLEESGTRARLATVRGAGFMLTADEEAQ